MEHFTLKQALKTMDTFKSIKIKIFNRDINLDDDDDDDDDYEDNDELVFEGRRRDALKLNEDILDLKVLSIDAEEDDYFLSLSKIKMVITLYPADTIFDSEDNDWMSDIIGDTLDNL